MMQHYSILRVVGRFLTPFLIMFALYIQFHGDLTPGGGFQSGVILAAAFILYGSVHGVEQLLRVIPFGLIRTLFCLGPMIYGGTGLAAWLMEKEYLNYNAFFPSDPVHSQHLGVMLVEIGVGLTVFSVMLTIFVLFSKRTPSTVNTES